MAAVSSGRVGSTPLESQPVASARSEFEIVVVGTSLGGLSALQSFLGGFPRDFPLPIAIAQHRTTTAGAMLRENLQQYSALRVREPEDKEAIKPGKAYLAPADYHLLVEEGFFSLSTEGMVNHARPSIQVLFESAAEAYGDAVIAVVLTGSSEDGAEGAARVKEAGGYLIVQDPETAESPILPLAVLKGTLVDSILPLEEIAPQLAALGRITA
jgi:two-component system chemotaxis response regulator CheB